MSTIPIDQELSLELDRLLLRVALIRGGRLVSIQLVECRRGLVNRHRLRKLASRVDADAATVWISSGVISTCGTP